MIQNFKTLIFLILATLTITISAKSPNPYDIHKGDRDKYFWKKGMNPFGENVFQIGYIQIENPVIIIYERNKGSMSIEDNAKKKWVRNVFVTSAECLPKKLDEHIIENSDNVYLLSPYPDIIGKFLMDLISSYNNPDDIWEYPEYNNALKTNPCDDDFEDWMRINDRISLKKFKEQPICFLLLLVNSNYFNSATGAIDGPSGFIRTDGPLQTYVRVAVPVCGISDSTKIPELLPWYSEKWRIYDTHNSNLNIK